MADPIVETARAKVNLSLTILGRRADGYHELESLVVFAEIGDRIVLSPDRPAGVTVSGPFAAEIDGGNLVERALEAARAAAPDLAAGHVHLDKHLPVAAGIGGGSADAAAVLRALRRLNARASGGVDWASIAAGLGADVTACLASRPLVMRGIGERIEPLPAELPPLPAVLVTPRVAVPRDKTAAVYRALAAPPLEAAEAATRRLAAVSPDSRTEVMRILAASGNDLERPATGLMPRISDVLQRLRSAPGVALARLSGSGPTCFALTESETAAAEVAAAIARDHPDWWVRATRLG